jgi:hypothetical protein
MTLTAMPPTAALPASMRVCSWPDPVIDRLGHDPHSAYVETYWLGILGPSTTWLMRRLAAGLDLQPDGYDLDPAETARCLGLGDKGGRSSPFVRSLQRLVKFELAQPSGRDELAVRRRIPPLSRRHLQRLPVSLQESHQAWQTQQRSGPDVDGMRRRSRQLALGLLELGEDPELIERQLLRWHYHPAMAHEALRWAWDTHSRAIQASSSDEPPTAA